MSAIRAYLPILPWFSQTTRVSATSEPFTETP